MHKRPESELLPVDTEIERTLRNLKKVKAVEKSIMAEQEGTDQHIPIEPVIGRPHKQRTMEEFWRPIIRDEYSAFKQPAIEANNFELKPALITKV